MYYICEIEKGEICTLVATFDCRRKCYKYGRVLYTKIKFVYGHRILGSLAKTLLPKSGGREQLTAELDTGRHIVPQTAKLCRDLYIWIDCFEIIIDSVGLLGVWVPPGISRLSPNPNKSFWFTIFCPRKKSLGNVTYKINRVWPKLHVRLKNEKRRAHGKKSSLLFWSSNRQPPNGLAKCVVYLLSRSLQSIFSTWKQFQLYRAPMFHRDIFKHLFQS